VNRTSQQEGGAEPGEQHTHRRQVRLGDPREDLPHLVAHEGEQGEDHQQRDRAGEEHEGGHQLPPHAPPHPVEDRDQAVREHRVDQQEDRQVHQRGDPGAAGLAPEDQRQERGHEHESGLLHPAHVARHRVPRTAPPAVDRRPGRQQDREAAGQRRHVREQRPLERDRAEHLADEHEGEQGRDAVEDVRGGGELLVEERQSGLTELPAALLDPLLTPLLAHGAIPPSAPDGVG
jgi:hypothetical protein